MGPILIRVRLWDRAKCHCFGSRAPQDAPRGSILKTVLPPGSPRDPPWDPRGPYKGKSEPPGSAKTTKSELSLKRGTKITKSTFWARKHQKWQKSAPGRLFGVPWEPILKTMSPPEPPRDPKKTPHRILESFSGGGSELDRRSVSCLGVWEHFSRNQC